MPKKGAEKNVASVGRTKRPRRGARLHHRLGRAPGDRGNNQHEYVDDLGERCCPGGEQQLDQRGDDDNLAVVGDFGRDVHADKPNHDQRKPHDGPERAPEGQNEVNGPHRFRHVSVDRLAEILKGGPEWHIRVIDQVLLEEDLGYGGFPAHKDISNVGDILRVGADGLAIRFREVDPQIWRWICEELEKLR